MWDSRAEAKKAQAERLAMAKQMGFNLGDSGSAKHVSHSLRHICCNLHISSFVGWP